VFLTIKDWIMTKKRRKRTVGTKTASKQLPTEAGLRAEGFQFLKLKGTKKVFAKNGVRVAIEGE